MPGGTLVTESFTYDNPARLLVMVIGILERNRRSMEETFERIEKLVTSSP